MKKVLIIALVCMLALSCFALAGCGVAGTYTFSEGYLITGSTTTQMKADALESFGISTENSFVLNDDKTGEIISVYGDTTHTEDITWAEVDGKVHITDSYNNVTVLSREGGNLVSEQKMGGVTIKMVYAKK